MPFNFIHAPPAGVIAGPAAAAGAEDTRLEMFRENIQAIQAAQQQQQIDQSQQQTMAHLANQRFLAGVQGQQQNNQNIAQMQRMLVGNQFDQQQQQNLFGQQNARDAVQDQSQKDYADYTAKIKADAEQRQNQEQVQWRNNAINFGVNDPQYSSFTAARDRELQSFDYLPGQQETLKKIRNDRQGILDNLGKGMDQKQAQQMWSDLNKEEMKVWPTEKKPDAQVNFNKSLVQDPSGQYWVKDGDGFKMGGKEKSDLPYMKQADRADKLFESMFKIAMTPGPEGQVPSRDEAAKWARQQVLAHAAFVDGTEIPVPATSDQVAPQDGAPADNRRQDSFPRPGDPGFAPNGQPPVAPTGPLPRLQLQEVRPDGTKGPVMQGFEGVAPSLEGGGQQQTAPVPGAAPAPQAPAGERPPARDPRVPTRNVSTTPAQVEAKRVELGIPKEHVALSEQAQNVFNSIADKQPRPPAPDEKAQGILAVRGQVPYFVSEAAAEKVLGPGAPWINPKTGDINFAKGKAVQGVNALKTVASFVLAGEKGNSAVLDWTLGPRRANFDRGAAAYQLKQFLDTEDGKKLPTELKSNIEDFVRTPSRNNLAKVRKALAGSR